MRSGLSLPHQKQCRQGAGQEREAQPLHRPCWTPSPGSGRSCRRAAWDSWLPEPRASHSPAVPLTFQGAGGSARPRQPGRLRAISTPGGRQAWACLAEGTGRLVLPPTHVRWTHVFLLIVTLAESLLWDRRVMHGQQGPQSPHSKGTGLSRGTRGHSVTECLGDTEWPGPGIAEVWSGPCR